MQYRIVQGEERERLLESRSSGRIALSPYLDVLEGVGDGEVVAVEVEDASSRGEKIRFSRAATRLNKSVYWLKSDTPNELVFEVRANDQRPRRRRRSEQSG